jgi:hypothetical protein
VNDNQIISTLTAIGVVLNTIWIIYSSWKKQKPEIKKIETEIDAEIAGAANLNLEGAKISAQMLLDRINELKIDLEQEKKSRKEEQEINERTRRDDIEYFRRRIKDLERESRDYRSWAAKLVKQVVEAGQIPVPFLPSINDTESKITKPRPDLESD